MLQQTGPATWKKIDSLVPNTTMQGATAPVDTAAK